jgi:CheY-like chemotaxis protein
MSSPLPTPRRRAPAATPRLAVTRGSRGAAPRAAADGAPPRILLVDDDPQLRAMFANFLRHAGYAVLEAQNGADALTVLEHERAPVHLVVTDVVMPHTGGPALVERLGPPARHPVLYLSGYAVDTEVTRRRPTPLTFRSRSPARRAPAECSAARRCPGAPRPDGRFAGVARADSEIGNSGDDVAGH